MIVLSSTLMVSSSSRRDRFETEWVE
jgi:hypothetical protein